MISQANTLALAYQVLGPKVNTIIPHSEVVTIMHIELWHVLRLSFVCIIMSHAKEELIGPEEMAQTLIEFSALTKDQDSIPSTYLDCG